MVSIRKEFLNLLNLNEVAAPRYSSNSMTVTGVLIPMMISWLEQKLGERATSRISLSLSEQTAHFSCLCLYAFVDFRDLDSSHAWCAQVFFFCAKRKQKKGSRSKTITMAQASMKSQVEATPRLADMHLNIILTLFLLRKVIKIWLGEFYNNKI